MHACAHTHRRDACRGGGTHAVTPARMQVFEREYSSRLYGLPAYFVSRWVVEAPNQIAFPVLSAVIVYWMIGYQNTAEKFGWCVGAYIE